MSDLAQTLSFNGVTLQTGDVVRFKAAKAAAGPFKQRDLEGAVMGITNDGRLRVFSPNMFALFGFQEDIVCFNAGSVSDLQVTRQASEAVPLQSGEQAFALNEHVVTTVGQDQYEGEVIAAFDEILLVRINDQEFIKGAAPYFRRAVMA